MKRLLGKTTLVVTLITLLGCRQDPERIDGRIIKVGKEYYRLNNTIGGLYRLDPVYMDTIIVVK